MAETMPASTELCEMACRIKESTTLGELRQENPAAFRKYKRTLIRIEEVVLRRSELRDHCEAIWVYDPTGTAMHEYSRTLCGITMCTSIPTTTRGGTATIEKQPSSSTISGENRCR